MNATSIIILTYTLELFNHTAQPWHGSYHSKPCLVVPAKHPAHTAHNLNPIFSATKSFDLNIFLRHSDPKKTCSGTNILSSDHGTYRLARKIR